MTAYSKWVIEYNVTQLIEREEYLPRFFKLVSRYKHRLNNYRLQNLKRMMNLSEYKNFLTKNIDEQCEWPALVQHKLEDRANDFDDKIKEV